MKASQSFLATLKEAPSDAEVVSHKLMVRAGLIRKLSAGIYNYLPLGLKVIRKVENIIREEMNRAGAIELLMPMIQPAELWQETGRWEKMGPELLRIKDRHDRDFLIQPTSEEVITDLARNEIKSYKQLPINFYQIQTKSPGYSMRGASLTVCESPTQVILLYKNKPQPYKTFNKNNRPKEVVASKDINAHVDKRTIGRKQKQNHPWYSRLAS